MIKILKKIKLTDFGEKNAGDIIELPTEIEGILVRKGFAMYKENEKSKEEKTRKGRPQKA